MTTLTADEITTAAEVFGHELTLAQLEWLEETITAHRDEAVTMADLASVPGGRHGGAGVAG